MSCVDHDQLFHLLLKSHVLVGQYKNCKYIMLPGEASPCIYDAIVFITCFFALKTQWKAKKGLRAGLTH